MDEPWTGDAGALEGSEPALSGSDTAAPSAMAVRLIAIGSVLGVSAATTGTVIPAASAGPLFFGASLTAESCVGRCCLPGDAASRVPLQFGAGLVTAAGTKADKMSAALGAAAAFALFAGAPDAAASCRPVASACVPGSVR
jgi:hypothetical protein